jgi:hypothetical protein
MARAWADAAFPALAVRPGFNTRANKRNPVPDGIVSGGRKVRRVEAD